MNKFLNFDAQDKDIIHKILFANSKKEFHEIAKAYMIKSYTFLDKTIRPQRNAFFIHNLSIEQATKCLSNLIAIYCYIIYSYLEEGDDQRAKNMFISLFQYKDLFDLLNLKIKFELQIHLVGYPILQRCMKQIIRMLSCLIFYANKFNLLMLHSYYFNTYFTFLSQITKRIRIFTNTNKQLPIKLTTFYNTFLSLSAYYNLWRMAPFEISILLLNYRTQRYNAIDDSDRADHEFVNQYKTYYNLGLIYYSDDQTTKAIESFKGALGVCDAILKGNTKKKDKLIDEKTKQMKLTVYVILLEINTENKNNYDAKANIETCFKLVEELESPNDKNKYNKEKRIMKFCLDEIEKALNQKTGEKEIVIMKTYTNEKASTIKSLYLDFEVEEMQKFCLFLSSLSMFQIKVLNDTQPIMSKSISLPICFSNQFTDCLSFPQRMTLLSIKVMQLHRFLILKNPDLLISLDNFNYDLISLENKELININDSIKKTSSRLSLEIEKNNQDFEHFLYYFHDKQFVKKNKDSLYSFFISMSKKKIQEYMSNPELIKELISSYKNEEILNSISRNKSLSHCYKISDIAKEQFKGENNDNIKSDSAAYQSTSL